MYEVFEQLDLALAELSRLQEAQALHEQLEMGRRADGHFDYEKTKWIPQVMTTIRAIVDDCDQPKPLRDCCLALFPGLRGKEHMAHTSLDVIRPQPIRYAMFVEREDERARAELAAECIDRIERTQAALIARYRK